MRSLFAVFLLAAAPALAQSTMITAAVNGDITRFSSVETDGLSIGDVFTDATHDGEAIGFTVGVARAIGERWGVAFEVGRTGEIENSETAAFDPRILIQVPLPPIGRPILDLAFERRTELQLTTSTALLWVKHSAGDRVELSYTAGLSLVSSESARTFSITDDRLLAIWALPTGLRTTEHRAAPVVGADAAITLTDHIALTAGIRAFVVEVAGTSGWLIRPGVGVRWTF